MSMLFRPRSQIAIGLVGLAVSACTPQARQDESSQAGVPQVAENGVAETAATAQAAEPRASSPTPKAKTGAIGESAMATNGTSDGLYVAMLKRALAIPLLAPTGTVRVKNGCLVATIDGIDHTVVLPPQARLIGPLNAPTAIKLSRRSVPVGRQMSLPAGGAEFSSSDLQSPIPDICPRKSIVFAG